MSEIGKGARRRTPKMISLQIPEMTSATEAELRTFLAASQVVRSELAAADKRVRRRLAKDQKNKPSGSRLEGKPEVVVEVGLPIPPVIAPELTPVGDINLLMNAVSPVVAPFDRIIIDLANQLVEQTKGLKPKMEVVPVKVGHDGENRRLVARWDIDRPVGPAELTGIYEAGRAAYEREINGRLKTGWEADSYEGLDGKVVPRRIGIYMGPNRCFDSDSTGVIVSRTFKSTAEADFLIEERPEDWIRSSTGDPSKIATAIEIREGPAQGGSSNVPGLDQDSLLELVVQMSYILATGKVIDRRVLMSAIFRALNRVGTAALDREKLFGMRSVLEVIERVLLFPLQQPTISKCLKLVPESVLLVGVPGVGKTLLAHYLMAGDYNAIFAAIDSARLREDLSDSNRTGASSILLKVDRIRELTALPVVLLIDDIDVILKDNDNILSRLLNLLRGIREKGLHIIASTNKPEEVDERLTEPGRLSKIIHVPLPNEAERTGVIQTYFDGRQFDQGVDLAAIAAHLANETDGWTQRYLRDICDEAARLAGMESVEGDISRPETSNMVVITENHILSAKSDVSQRIPLERIRKRDAEISDFVSRRAREVGFRHPS